jgi:hypothetical protein
LGESCSPKDTFNGDALQHAPCLIANLDPKPSDRLAAMQVVGGQLNKGRDRFSPSLFQVRKISTIRLVYSARSGLDVQEQLLHSAIISKIAVTAYPQPYNHIAFYFLTSV